MYWKVTCGNTFPVSLSIQFFHIWAAGSDYLWWRGMGMVGRVNMPHKPHCHQHYHYYKANVCLLMCTGVPNNLEHANNCSCEQCDMGGASCTRLCTHTESRCLGYGQPLSCRSCLVPAWYLVWNLAVSGELLCATIFPQILSLTFQGGDRRTFYKLFVLFALQTLMPVLPTFEKRHWALCLKRGLNRPEKAIPAVWICWN